MLKSIWDDIKREYSYGNMVTRIVIVNVSVFVLINLVRVILWASNGGVMPSIYSEIVHFLSMSSDPWYILTHPWVIFTSMFLHEGLWHILFNMLFLYWFGRIVGDFIGNHRILPIYLMGGLVGNLFFFLSANMLAYGAGSAVFALGASGAVMAIVMASAVLAPDYQMRLILIGDVKLKYVVAVLIFLDIIALTGTNTGGHFAHIGGVIFGALFISLLRSGTDLSAPVNSAIQWVTQKKTPKVSTRKKSPRVPFMVYKNEDAAKKKKSNPSAAPRDDDFQQKLDAILEKIKAEGYESLTQEEKEFLFQASKK